MTDHEPSLAVPQEALARTPELIEEGLSLLDRELPTEVGGIDLYARDRSGRLASAVQRPYPADVALQLVHRLLPGLAALQLDDDEPAAP